MAGLFGMPYEGDPTGALLGQNYNSQVEQEQKLWGLLEGAGQALLHPTKGSGDLGALANAFTGGAKSMNEAGTSYLATAYERKKAQDDLRRKQKEEDDQLALERDAVSWMKQFDPKTQEMINGNPQMAKDYWDAFLKERAAASRGGGSGNTLGAGQPWYDENGQLHWFQPSLDPTQESKITDLPVGAKSAISPELRGEQAAAKTRAEENQKKLALLPLGMTQSEDIVRSIDDIMSRPDLQQYLGLNSVWKNLPDTQTTGVMAELKQLAGAFRLQALPLWKGSGPLTEAEGEASVAAAMAAEQSQTPADFYYNMAKAKWHAEAAYRIANAQYQSQDTFKYVSKKEIMKDVPYPKREDFLNAGKPPKATTPEALTDELQKALELYPD